MEKFNERRGEEKREVKASHGHMEGSGEGNGDRRDKGEEGKRAERMRRGQGTPSIPLGRVSHSWLLPGSWGRVRQNTNSCCERSAVLKGLVGILVFHLLFTGVLLSSPDEDTFGMGLFLVLRLTKGPYTNMWSLGMCPE